MIFHHIPRMTGISKDEWISRNDTERFEDVDIIDIPDFSSGNSNVNTEWELTNDLQGSAMSIQKKFIPWKSMLLDLGILSPDNSVDCFSDVVLKILDYFMCLF
jgi:hypothetical protein